MYLIKFKGLFIIMMLSSNLHEFTHKNSLALVFS